MTCRGEVINGGFGLVLDGTEEAAERLKMMLSWDVLNGVGFTDLEYHRILASSPGSLPPLCIVYAILFRATQKFCINKIVRIKQRGGGKPGNEANNSTFKDVCIVVLQFLDYKNNIQTMPTDRSVKEFNKMQMRINIWLLPLG